jgi:hypothetical protein
MLTTNELVRYGIFYINIVMEEDFFGLSTFHGISVQDLRQTG